MSNSEGKGAATRSPGASTVEDAETGTAVLKLRRVPSSGDPIVTMDGKVLRPAYSQEVRNLSREEGFGWGYRGAAPAQLALAVLLEVTYTEEALRLFQPFKERFLAPMRFVGGEIPVATIKSWVEAKRTEEAEARQRMAATARLGPRPADSPGTVHRGGAEPWLM